MNYYIVSVWGNVGQRGIYSSLLQLLVITLINGKALCVTCLSYQINYIYLWH